MCKLMLNINLCIILIDKRVYVSVTVGHNRKRTKAFKGDGIPYWNEEFSLLVHIVNLLMNLHERMNFFFTLQ